MTHIARKRAAGALGGLAAGIALSALHLTIERSTGRPSELVRLGRKAATALGSPYLHQDTVPALDEQLRYHGGHLALSAMMGLAYPVMRRVPGFGGAAGGMLFGVAFYPLFWILLGPLLGLTPPPRQDAAAAAARRVGLHALFGAITALVAGAVGTGEKPGRDPA